MNVRQRLRRLGLAAGFEVTRVRRTVDGRAIYSDVQEHIERLLTELDISGRYCVDIAAADGRQGSSTFPLFRDGWSGLAVEADAFMFERLAINYSALQRATLHRGFVTPLNVVSLLAAAGAPSDFAFLSLDIDGYDYDVLKVLLSAYRPKLMCVEHNEKIPPPVSFARHYSADLEYSGVCYGHSLAAVNALALEHGYVLLGVWYHDAFFAPAECGRETTDIVTAYRQGYLDRPDRLQRMPWNQPFEALHSMAPAEIVAFLNSQPDFKARRGQYTLTPD